MKKFVVSILAILYLSVSSGIAMEIHYCMGKVAGVEFYGGDNDRCGRCGMKEKKGGCCSDEYKFYKLQDAHKNTSNAISFDFHPAVMVTSYALPQPALIADLSNRSCIRNNSPPPDTGPSLRALYCIYRL